MEFKWADSETVYNEMEDFYCDGDAAPLGRMNYVYQNYIPGVSEISYPEPETAASSEAASSETVSSATTREPETDAPEGGCSSTVGAAAILITTAIGACVLLRRKEN